ncbi:hypothetical protein KA111_01075 [Candidatus Woesebacteria bacterium]|nr:hypothetical protein [Candidatus Woesebacteria bacterium]
MYKENDDPQKPEKLYGKEITNFKDVPELKMIIKQIAYILSSVESYFGYSNIRKPDHDDNWENLKQLEITLDNILNIIGHEIETKQEPRISSTIRKVYSSYGKKEKFKEVENKWRTIKKHSDHLNSELKSIFNLIISGASETRISDEIEKFINFIKNVNDPEWDDRAAQYMEYSKRTNPAKSDEENVEESRFWLKLSQETTNRTLYPNKLRGVLELAKKLKENLEPTLNQDQSKYAKVLNMILNDKEKSPHLVSSSSLTEEDDGKSYYFPQLHIWAIYRTKDKYFKEKTVSYFESYQNNYLPPAENLFVIKSSIMFPNETQNKAEVETVKNQSKPIKSLQDFLSSLQEIKGEPNPFEVMDLNDNLTEDMQLDFILKGINLSHITRNDLLKAGYVFLNGFGGGEKFIINKIIDGVDFGKLAVLTQEQLDRAIAIDLEESGKIRLTPAEISSDMFELLHATEYLVQKRKEQILEEIYNSRTKDGQTDAEFDLEAKQKVKTIIDEEWKDFVAGKNNLFGRKMPLEEFLISRGLRSNIDVPCPCLNCGYRLTKNRDVTLVDENGPVRISTIVAHLASHGISEQGDGGKISVDQRYMTLKQYSDLIMANK